MVMYIMGSMYNNVYLCIIWESIYDLLFGVKHD